MSKVGETCENRHSEAEANQISLASSDQPTVAVGRGSSGSLALIVRATKSDLAIQGNAMALRG